MATLVHLDYRTTKSSYNKNVQASIRDPPGFAREASTVSKGTSKTPASLAVSEGKPSLAVLRAKRGWETAFSPAKSIPMQGFMMWMAGNSVQIFSMMSIFSCLKGSVGGILNVNKTFAPLVVQPLPNASASSSDMADVDNMLPQKGVYVLCQAILLGLALYKCQSMGLLPTSPSDWLAFKRPPIALEWSGSPAL